jgi:ABC-2 type transport system ATP-binding protein
MSDDEVIRTVGLTKVYPGGVKAVDHLDLSVRRGEIFGLLGPNGAGKTTMTRILATLIEPTAGTAQVGGFDVVKDAHKVRQLIGLTGQYAGVDEMLTGTENLVLIGRLLGISRKDSKARAAELLERFQLTEAAERAAKTYSGGMRRRLDLAASLVRRPEVLFLDEPTTGLDPASRNQIWDAVRELTADGTTVLLTTQYLEEADRLADDIVLVDHGRVAHSGTPDQFKASIGAHVEVVVTDADVMVKAAAVLDRLTGAEPSFDHDRGAVGAVTRDVTLTLPRLVRELDTAGVPLLDVSLKPPTLDDVFLRLTQDRSHDHEERAA